MSQSTAEKLIQAGKGDWLTKRQDVIEVKGKGMTQTYWAEPRQRNTDSSCTASSTTSDDSETGDAGPNRPVDVSSTTRLVDWNTKMLQVLIKRLVAHRVGSEIVRKEKTVWRRSESVTVRDEVVESIEVPPFQERVEVVDPDTIELDCKVVEQLHSFVCVIAHAHRSNPFHSFDRASHVAMSTNTLVNRIISSNMGRSQQEMYMNSYGLASDPLVQLAIVFSALIHDCDHRGYPNSVLNKEEPSLAARYGGKSTAEQNSVDIGWGIFMEPAFDDLRDCLFAGQNDLNRFRQMVVNSVIATDISDTELKRIREKRWAVAFSEYSTTDDHQVFRKRATVVLEHIVQVSDACHAMQHWAVYRKWNRSLFEETYDAYRSGRLEHDPSTGWYDSELSFFDDYVLPLAGNRK